MRVRATADDLLAVESSMAEYLDLEDGRGLGVPGGMLIWKGFSLVCIVD